MACGHGGFANRSTNTGIPDEKVENTRSQLATPVLVVLFHEVGFAMRAHVAMSVMLGVGLSNVILGCGWKLRWRRGK